MKLTVSRKIILSALAIVKPAALARGSLPILSNVRLAASSGKLELTCSDMDVTIRTSIPVDIAEPGKTTVNVGVLHGLISSFTKECDFELQALTNDLKITTGDCRYKIGTLPTDDFPPFPKLKDPSEFELPQPVFRSLLADTLFCQSTDETRMVLNGSLVSLNGALVVVGCDGRRLAIEEAQLDDVEKLKLSLILPRKCTDQLLRLLTAEAPDEEEEEESDDQSDKSAKTKDSAKGADKSPSAGGEGRGEGGHSQPRVAIAASTNTAHFQIGDTVLVTKLIEGTYPDYRKVVPDQKDMAAGVEVGRPDLLAILKRIDLFSDNCNLEFEGQMLTIRSQGKREIPGEAVETLLIAKTKKLTMGFSTQYLIEALQAIDDDIITLHCADDKTPMVMKSPSRSWLHVSCPLIKAAPKSEPEKPAAPAGKPGPKQDELPGTAKK